MKCASCECSMYDANVVCIMRMYYVLCECVSLIVFCTLPQTGNTVPYYLFNYGNTENINLNILLGCLLI